jgi:hypothetical protein
MSHAGLQMVQDKVHGQQRNVYHQLQRGFLLGNLSHFAHTVSDLDRKMYTKNDSMGSRMVGDPVYIARCYCGFLDNHVVCFFPDSRYPVLVPRAGSLNVLLYRMCCDFWGVSQLHLGAYAYVYMAGKQFV